MFIPKLSSSCVSLKRLLRTISGTSPRFSSMTARMPDLSDSSRMSEMPSIFFSRASSPIRGSRFDLLTWYGISSMTIACRLPFSSSSMCVRARITTRPRPVR
jgi:hypothetical protein